MVKARTSLDASLAHCNKAQEISAEHAATIRDVARIMAEQQMIVAETIGLHGAGDEESYNDSLSEKLANAERRAADALMDAAGTAASGSIHAYTQELERAKGGNESSACSTSGLLLMLSGVIRRGIEDIAGQFDGVAQNYESAASLGHAAVAALSSPEGS